MTANGWFAVRLWGGEDICRIYAAGFGGAAHLPRILDELQALVEDVIPVSTNERGIASGTNEQDE